MSVTLPKISHLESSGSWIQTGILAPDSVTLNTVFYYLPYRLDDCNFLLSSVLGRGRLTAVITNLKD